MKRRTPPKHLTHGFHQSGLSWYLHGQQAPDRALRLYDGGPACWLAQFDHYDRPCEGRLEVIHLIGRQRIEKILKHQLVTDLWAEGTIDTADVLDLVELAEWDDRNAAPGCTGHHRRADNQATPELKIPFEALRVEAVEFITDHGFESEAERRFVGTEFPLTVVSSTGQAMPIADAPVTTVVSSLRSEACAAAGLQQQPLVGGGAENHGEFAGANSAVAAVDGPPVSAASGESNPAGISHASQGAPLARGARPSTHPAERKSP